LWAFGDHQWALTYYEVEMNLLISHSSGWDILEWIELHVGFPRAWHTKVLVYFLFTALDIACE
jgi:hypothetical protein